MRTNGKSPTKFLLDTNIMIAFFAQEAAILRALAGEEYFLSAVVLGELYFEACKSGKPQSNSQRVDNLAKGRAVLDCDLETARIYGTIKNALRAKGPSVAHFLPHVL